MGTTFRIFLPVSERARFTAARARTPLAAVRAPSQTVLVVDDEAIVRNMATAALRAGGIPRARWQPMGRKRSTFCAPKPSISLVILDLTMPVMTGEQALPLIQAMRPEIPMILSSGFNEAEISRRFASAGIAGVLQKPYTVSAITSKVTHALQAAGSVGPRADADVTS